MESGKTEKKPDSLPEAGKKTPEHPRKGRSVLFVGMGILAILAALSCFFGYRIAAAMKQGAYATARKGQKYTLLFCEWHKPGYLDQVGKHGNPPVVSAAANRDTKSLVLLLDCGADPDVVTSHRSARSALHDAVFTGNTEATEALLRHGANPNIVSFFRQTPLDEVYDPEFPLPAVKKTELANLLKKYGGKTAAELELERTRIPGEN